MYIILDGDHLAFFTGRIDPNSYKIVPRKSGAESMEQTVTGDATAPHPTEVRPPPSRRTPLPDGVTMVEIGVNQHITSLFYGKYVL